MAKKQFIFLYPEDEIFNFEIQNGSYCWDDKNLQDEFNKRFEYAKTDKECDELREEYRDRIEKIFRPIYSQKLNLCIDKRYRKKEYQINFALFNDTEISNVINFYPEDRIIYVGLDAKIHRTKSADGTYPYPNQDYILNQLEEIKNLIVAGFHFKDCVDKLAKRAYDRGIEVMVDEELTELFGGFIKRQDFNPEFFPSVNPKNFMDEKFFIECFLELRKDKPWLYKYS